MKKESPIISFEAEAHTKFWSPFNIHFQDGGIHLTIDADQEFPMLAKKQYPIQENKKYRIEISEINNGNN